MDCPVLEWALRDVLWMLERPLSDCGTRELCLCSALFLDAFLYSPQPRIQVLGHTLCLSLPAFSLPRCGLSWFEISDHVFFCGDAPDLPISTNDVFLISNRKHRLTRTQSAFSPVVFSPLFTGETVSLVDVDISQRGLTSPHPPTPPPPPRRSLSLLDAFPRIVPLRPMEAMPGQPTPHLQCPLYRPDSSSFAASLRELEKCGWYWGPMNWEDAEMKLKGKPDGSFLVRDSSDPRYILSLSFRSQGITHHTRMEHYRGTFSLWCHPKFEDRCQSVVEFIKRAIMHSKNGKFLYFLRSRVPGLPPTPVQLLYPVSRFSNVKSLQHLCRFRIRQLVRIDHIPDLPLPKPLISYIRKFYYYDPQEEVYLSLKEAQLISKQKQETESST
uniref:Suppressor of cytokine signaling 7 n=1 Tax=Buteo japonicus TaxID=224669 RepID=A0A8B9Z4I8_9AVES